MTIESRKMQRCRVVNVAGTDIFSCPDQEFALSEITQFGGLVELQLVAVRGYYFHQCFWDMKWYIDRAGKWNLHKYIGAKIGNCFN